MGVRIPKTLVWVALCVPLASLAGATLQEATLPVDGLPEDLGHAAPLGLPAHVAADREQDALAALGRRLFFDSILSVDRSRSCASCHIPEKGFADNQRFSAGVGGKRTERNTPTLFNRVLGKRFMWLGEASSLAEQALLPIENPREMGLPMEQALQRLAADAGYVGRFKETLGSAPSEEGLGKALEAFLVRILKGDSPVDHFRQGKRDFLTQAQRGGLWFFESRGGCWRCHSGPNFSDEEFHNTGVGVRDGQGPAGRSSISGLASDRGAFKTPTLRGLSLTAPYMHDGSLETLEEVVEFYRQGGHVNPHLDPRIQPLEMSDADVANLVAFLKAL